MTVRRSRQERAATGRGMKIALWSVGALIVLAIVGIIGGKAWIESYLRSDRFRQFVSRKTAETLEADGQFSPFNFTGSSFYSDGFTARGSERSWFAAMSLNQLRADVSARRFFEGVWQIEQVVAQRVAIDLEGTRVTLPERPPAPPEARGDKNAGWLPRRVEIGSANIRETNLSWGKGADMAGTLRGTALTVEPHDGGWSITGHGGQLTQARLPVLAVQSAKLRYREPSLFIQSAEFSQGTTGRLSVTGEVQFERELDLQVKLSGISVTPLLPEDWRARLHGDLGGDVRVRSPLPFRGAPPITGTLTLANGRLEALPILDQIATFTRAQQFRHLVLSKVSAEFTQEPGRLSVTGFVAESEGLLRIEGGFTVVKEVIDGSFQVGVTPASLQWLPGSQERVFTASRGGYLWTPMRLTGPLGKPAEDLSPRLIAAAQAATIEAVGKTATDAIKTGSDAIKSGTDAAKSAIDLLMPLLK